MRVHRPDQRHGASPGLLWMHGGGYVMGMAVQDDKLCRQFAQELGIVVAAVDYRLAPEHPFPVPLEDCYQGLEWLVSQPDVDPCCIAIGGASAGGGLAAALAILTHERGQIQIVLQSLAYPMLDDRTAVRRELDEGQFRMWDNKSNRFGWSSYTRRTPGSPDISPLAAPARHTDLVGLPPAWIGVGTCDLFCEEDVDYANRLICAGVPCTLELVQGAYHGFDAVQPKARVSQAFRSSQMRGLAHAFKRSP
jgi:acetyl esterase/lipase